MEKSKIIEIPLGLNLFGISSETAPIVRANLFTQIHEICFHGKGGYDWLTIYNMPRWLRQFTFNKINEFYQKEAEQYEKVSSKNNNKSTLVDSMGNVDKNAWNNIPKPVTPTGKSSVKYK